jgi:hypothetical protein
MPDINVLAAKADQFSAKVDSVINGMTDDPKVSDLLKGQKLMQSAQEGMTQVKQVFDGDKTIKQTVLRT